MASAETEASAGAVFALAETGRALQLVHSMGFDGDVSESFGRLSMEEASPLTDAIRAGTTLWVDSGAPPHPRFPAPGETCGAWGVIPLMVGSRVLGGVVLAVTRVPRFAEQEQSYMFAQATQCALAFERSLLFREVQQASAEKTRFLAAISHDLRTPVNAVLLLSSLVRKDAEALGLSDGAKLLERCRRIESAATSFAELLNNLLDISSLEVGHKRMKEENFFLAEVLAECAATLRGLAKAKGLALNVRCHDARLGLRADRTELTRVLMNLVGNAIKFTETGSVAVDTGRSPEGGLWIRVEDTGPGISGEYLPYLFNEFFQIENKERSRVQGSGLGLAISFRIMRALDGELRVDTEPGKGSVFTVILPAPRVLSEMEDQPDTLGLERTRPTRPKGSLLIIDDDLVFTEALAEILKESGYSVRVADRGDDGLELLAKEKSDVVLLDMMMPGIDGVDVIRRIRSQPALKHTRIIVLTGDVTRERTQAVQAAGADAFLGKPLQVPALLATIRKEMEGAEDPRVSRAALRRTTVPPVR
jgi:signal transduction histidine kinase/ActR/RegA family two-component response regulator